MNGVWNSASKSAQKSKGDKTFHAFLNFIRVPCSFSSGNYSSIVIVMCFTFTFIRVLFQMLP